MQFDNIPNELKKYNNWVCWKAEEMPNGKVSKKPVNAKNRRVRYE